LRSLLKAAWNTRHYRSLLVDAGCLAPGDLDAPGAAERALRRLPPVAYSALRCHPEAFANRQNPKPTASVFFCPMPPTERIAVLASGFRAGRGVRVFPEPSRSKLIHFHPAVLAGPVGTLRHLADAAEDQGAPMPRVSHGVVAFSGPHWAFLSDEARRLLWRVFEVPVFGQFLGLDGELLAWECEAHEGWHVREEDAIFDTDEGGGDPELLVTSLASLHRPLIRVATGLSGRLERSACGCGRTCLRLIGLRRRNLTPIVAPAPEAAMAASCAAD
jgi:hypothetical protein